MTKKRIYNWINLLLKTFRCTYIVVIFESDVHHPLKLSFHFNYLNHLISIITKARLVFLLIIETKSFQLKRQKKQTCAGSASSSCSLILINRFANMYSR